MDCLSIDELLIIFKHLDAKSLKNAALVCKKWNDIISQSTSLMSKYRISYKMFKTYDDITSFNRVVHTLNIGAYTYIIGADYLKMIPDICSWHGSQIRNLSIFNCQFSHPKEFHDVLQSMPLLEQLNLSNLKFTNDFEGFMQPVELKRLNKLRVMVTTANGFIFRYLHGSQPKSLRLNTDEKEMKLFNEFLESLERLESLHLVGVEAISTFLQMDSSKFRFKLKKLEMDWGQSTGNVDTGISNYFRSQALSLEELSLRYASDKVVEKALTSLQFLKILRTDSCVYPTEKSFYDSLKPIVNLRELYIGNVLNEDGDPKLLIKKCPMLTTLEVKGWEVPFARQNVMKKMLIDGLMPEIEPEIKLHFLKNLSITGGIGDTINNMISFLQNNLTIENIGRTYIACDKTLPVFVETLLNMPNLKYAELQGDVDVLKAIYDGFSASEHRQTKSLLLIFDERSCGFPKVRFQFPQDAGQWDTKCAFVKIFVRANAVPTIPLVYKPRALPKRCCFRSNAKAQEQL